MDKIWDRNPSKSEVIGRCGGDEKNKRPRRTDKSRTLKKQKNKKLLYIFMAGWCISHLNRKVYTVKSKATEQSMSLFT